MKKLLNRRIALVLVAVIATVAFFSFKSGDDRNFQIAKNLDTFNAIVKELDMFYVDTIDPNKTIREGIAGSLYRILPGGRSKRTGTDGERKLWRYRFSYYL